MIAISFIFNNNRNEYYNTRYLPNLYQTQVRSLVSLPSKPSGSILDIVLLTAKGTLLGLGCESSSSSRIGSLDNPSSSFFLNVRLRTVAFLSPYLL